jgi:hypothetical protein
MLYSGEAIMLCIREALSNKGVSGPEAENMVRLFFPPMAEDASEVVE